MNIRFGLFLMSALAGLAPQLAPGAEPSLQSTAAPDSFPSSPVIQSIAFDTAHLKRAAPGSDLWPVTWADDDGLYPDGLVIFKTGQPCSPIRIALVSPCASTTTLVCGAIS